MRTAEKDVAYDLPHAQCLCVLALLGGEGPLCNPSSLCSDLYHLGQALSKHRPCPKLPTGWQEGQAHGHVINLTITIEHQLCSTGLEQGFVYL